jgi:hypothetical protein
MNRNFYTVIILLVLIQLCAVLKVDAQYLNQPLQNTGYLNPKSFNWKEFVDNGKQLLDESGFLLTVGNSFRASFLKKNNFYTELDIDAYFGKVDYNGFLQPESTRKYFGVKLGYTF